MNMKKKKQKQSLDKVIRQSFAYHQKEEDERNKRTSENMMEWNKKHLSPSGGKKAFVKTQNEQPKPKRHNRWLTKSDNE